MNKEEVQNMIEQVAYDGATDGCNRAVIEREAEKLATELVKLFAIPVVMQRSELLLFADYSESDKTSQTTDECVDNYLAQKQ